MPECVTPQLRPDLRGDLRLGVRVNADHAGRRLTGELVCYWGARDGRWVLLRLDGGEHVNLPATAVRTAGSAAG